MRAWVGTALLQLERNGALVECMPKCCRKGLDTADIVRDAWLQQLSLGGTPGFISFSGNRGLHLFCYISGNMNREHPQIVKIEGRGA